MDINKKLITVLILSLTAGASLAGVLYVLKTPTDIAPEATSAQQTTPTQRPHSADSSTSPTPASTLTPTSDTDQNIINAFTTDNPTYDINHDGTINTLDLIKHRQ